MSAKVILGVDENVDRQERTKAILAEQGYIVLTAESAEEAETLCDTTEAIHLIVTGVVMTGDSGIHLAEHVEASDRSISTLLISHFSRDLLRMVRGFSRQPEFLPNPFTAEELLTRVRRLLEEHSN